jgi:hypothetical protein
VPYGTDLILAIALAMTAMSILSLVFWSLGQSGRPQQTQ